MKDDDSLGQPSEDAIADKLTHLQHEEWLARRHATTDASIAEALAILDRPTDDVDLRRELPEETGTNVSLVVSIGLEC